MNITVTNRHTIESTDFISKYKYPHVIISIYGSRTERPQIPKSVLTQEILYVQFDDVYGYAELDREFKLQSPISQDQARKIIEFIQKYININDPDAPENSDLIIHCRAGMSRSVATAVAISEILYGSRYAEQNVTLIDISSFCFVNHFVKHKILSEYNDNLKRYNPELYANMEGYADYSLDDIER